MTSTTLTCEILANAEISRRILELCSTGVGIREAIDAVCGAGTVANAIDEVYDTLRNRGK